MSIYIGKIKVSDGMAVNINNEDITITENGVYTPDENHTGLGSVTVNVQPTLEHKTIIANGTYNAIDDNADGYNNVIVNVPTITPTGTLTISSNGTYDVTNYASADVNVSGGSSFIGIPREVSSNGVFQMPTASFTFSLPNDVVDIGREALANAFMYCTGLTSVDLSSLRGVNSYSAMFNAFWGCENLTSVDLSNLTRVSDNGSMRSAFVDCENLTSVNLSNLTTVDGYYTMSGVFNGCKSLTSVVFPSLTTINGDHAMSNAFYRCANLTSVDLSSLTTISGIGTMIETFRDCTSLTSVNFSNLSMMSGSAAMQNAFKNCTSLTELSFPALTRESLGSNQDQFRNMLSGVEGCKVHFPNNMRFIGGWSDVQNGFGGTNTTVLFDLPATT